MASSLVEDQAGPGRVMMARTWVVQQGRQWMEQKHFEDPFDRAWVTESEG